MLGDKLSATERLELWENTYPRWVNNSSQSTSLLLIIARDATAEIAALRKELERLQEALTPSAVYIGEFSFNIPDCDEDGNEVSREVSVPWTTVKEIMAAIRKRAAIASPAADKGEVARRLDGLHMLLVDELEARPDYPAEPAREEPKP